VACPKGDNLVVY